MKPSHLLLLLKAAVKQGRFFLMFVWFGTGERRQAGRDAAPRPSGLCIPGNDKLNPMRLLKHGAIRYSVLEQLERC